MTSAIKEFGYRGFAAVSTRDLAELAEVNLAAIRYHFGGKEGLYNAVLDQIIEEARAECGSVAKTITAKLDEGGLSNEEGEELIRLLVPAIVSFLVGKQEDRWRSALIIRKLMNPSDGFDRLYNGYMKQVHTAVTRLVAAMLDEDAESSKSVMRAHALLGQIIFFSAGRELIKARTDGAEFEDSHLLQISEVVTETFIASIRGIRQTS